MSYINKGKFKLMNDEVWVAFFEWGGVTIWLIAFLKHVAKSWCLVFHSWAVWPLGLLLAFLLANISLHEKCIKIQQKSNGHGKSDKFLFQTFWRHLSVQLLLIHPMYACCYSDFRYICIIVWANVIFDRNNKICNLLFYCMFVASSW